MAGVGASGDYAESDLKAIATMKERMGVSEEVHREVMGTLGLDMDEIEDFVADKDACIICQENKIDNVFIPCGHMCSCTPCATRMSQTGNNKCPLCRKDVMSMFKVYKHSI
jgi:hypothetical protein